MLAPLPVSIRRARIGVLWIWIVRLCFLGLRWGLDCRVFGVSGHSRLKQRLRQAISITLPTGLDLLTQSEEGRLDLAVSNPYDSDRRHSLSLASGTMHRWPSAPSGHLLTKPLNVASLHDWCGSGDSAGRGPFNPSA